MNDLVNCGTAAVADVVALRAALMLVNRDRGIDILELHQLVLLEGGHSLMLALRAQNLNESLCDNADQRGCNHVRCNAHIYQTDDGRSCVVGMQGRQNQVTGDSGTDTDIRRLRVTHLTDHDDIRVLTEDGSQSCCEGHTSLGIYLNLIDTVDRLLDRVLNGDNIYIGLCELTERCVQSRGLTGTGRSCYQDYAVRALDHGLKELVVVVGHTEVSDLTECDVTGGKDTDNDLLTVYSRQRGYTDIKYGAVNGLGETTVLRDTLLGDVHAGDELQTGGQCVMNDIGDLHELYQVAVYTDTDNSIGLERLDMNIGRVCAEGVLDDGGSELYDRCALYSVSGLIVTVVIGLELLYGLKYGVNVLHRVVLTDRLVDRGSGCEYRDGIHTGLHLDILEDIEVDRVICCNSQTTALDVDGDNRVLLREALRDLTDCILVDLLVCEINIGNTELCSKSLCEVDLGDESELYNHFAKALGTLCFLLCSQNLVKLFSGDELLLYKVITNFNVSHTITSILFYNITT